MSEPGIELRGLKHRYGTPTRVLRDVNLSIEQGEIFGFLGRNGAGKTTAMNILTTLITPTAGTRDDLRLRRGHPAARRDPLHRVPPRRGPHVRAPHAAGEPRVLRQALRRRPTPARRRWRRSTTSGASSSPSAASARSPPACDSGSGSRRPSCTARRCCFLDEPTVGPRPGRCSPAPQHDPATEPRPRDDRVHEHPPAQRGRQGVHHDRRAQPRRAHLPATASRTTRSDSPTSPPSRTSTCAVGGLASA